MVNIKPTLWKVIVSLLGGIVVALFNFYQGYKMYWTYENTPRLAQYGYSFLEIIVRNGFLSQMIWGLVLGIITIYLIYSLMQNEKSKWMLMKLFLFFLVATFIRIGYKLNNCNILSGYGCNSGWPLFVIYDILLLIYLGIKYLSNKK